MKNLIVEKATSLETREITPNLYEVIDKITEMVANMKRSSYPKVIFEIGILRMMGLLNKQSTVKKENVNVKELTIDTSNEEIIKKEEPVNEEIVESQEKQAFEEPVDVKEEEGNLQENVEKPSVKLANIIENNRQIRIRNALATADKKILNDLKIRLVNCSDYLHNKEFASVVSYLMDGTLRVVGEKQVIISLPYDSMLSGAFENIAKIEVLLNLVCNKHYLIAFVSDDEWNEVKDKYIKDKNAGLIYATEEEVLITEEMMNETKTTKDLSKAATDAISLFGNDLVEIN